MENLKGLEVLNLINMNIKDNLKMENIMGKVDIHGPQDQFTKANMKMVRSMVMEFTKRPTETAMKEAGLTANAMAKDTRSAKKDKKSKYFTKTDKSFHHKIII